MYRRSIEIDAKALGKGHPDYAASVNDLAILYYQMGAYPKAEPLYHEALAMVAYTEGKEHPHYALSLDDLGVLYLAMGAYEKAEPVFRGPGGPGQDTWARSIPDYAQRTE